MKIADEDRSETHQIRTPANEQLHYQTSYGFSPAPPPCTSRRFLPPDTQRVTQHIPSHFYFIDRTYVHTIPTIVTDAVPNSTNVKLNLPNTDEPTYLLLVPSPQSAYDITV